MKLEKWVQEGLEQFIKLFIFKEENILQEKLFKSIKFLVFILNFKLN